MALTRMRGRRPGALWAAALCLLRVAIVSAGHDPGALPATGVPANDATTVATSTVAPATPAKPASLPPGCRTFYVHGDAHNKDGAEYEAQLLWREHAVVDEEGQWALALNVTATEGARVVLGGAARNLQGQPRYELVLGAFANESRLLVHADSRNSDRSAAPAAPIQAHQPLFEKGGLQLWLRWKVTAAASGARGRLEAVAQTAGSPDQLLLLSYETAVPLQVETFSFGSTRPGDVTFAVCKAVGGHGGSQPADAGLGVPGCRSLILHKSALTHSHSMAVGWADVADSHGRLQFWARASTDVEVLVTERLDLAARRGHLATHHVVFGGDFNTKSWVVVRTKSSLRRAAEVSTPTLLSDAQFRPLWVAVPPHSRGVVKAGSGEVRHHHKATYRELISWSNPDAPAPANFVTFATYKNRLVHVLIDCDDAPAPVKQKQPNGAALLDAVRSSAALAVASAHSSPPTLELDIERLGLHDGSLTATGTLMQKWQYGNDSGVEWDPAWFQGVLKFQYWLTGMDDELLGSDGVSDLLVVSSAGGNKSHSKLVPGPIQVNYDKKISWNFHLHLKMPCEHDEKEGTVSCSVTAELNSKSNSCLAISTSNLDHKWKVNWKIFKPVKKGKCQMSLTVTTEYHIYEKYGEIPQHTVIMLWLYIFTTSLSLCILLMSYHPNNRKLQYLLSVYKTLIQKLHHRQDFGEENLSIVAFDGGAAHIKDPDSDDLNTDAEKINKVKPQAENENFSVLKQQKSAVLLLVLSLSLSITDLFVKLATA